MLMFFHPHPAVAERHAFSLEAQSLFQAVLTRQHDFSASAHHPMPGQAARATQRPHHLPGASRKTRGTSHVTICRYLPFRNGSNSVADSAEQSRPIARGTTPACGAAPAPA